ncbi:hypothetical protein BB558_002703 [Smittium angustum]|uniref:Uncharacterized protein n=1 Tax=Smittium angustum TaxID=133377 RepID=A0A2U1J873_SMIAN|nr:hypothetical protein BB558_002703 [Smittium angustum]
MVSDSSEYQTLQIFHEHSILSDQNLSIPQKKAQLNKIFANAITDNNISKLVQMWRDWSPAGWIEVNKPDQDGTTPLILACCFGRLEIAKYLVDIGANINSVDSYGWSPIMWAHTNNHSQIVQFLSSKGSKTLLPNFSRNHKPHSQSPDISSHTSPFPPISSINTKPLNDRTPTPNIETQNHITSEKDKFDSILNLLQDEINSFKSIVKDKNIATEISNKKQPENIPYSINVKTRLSNSSATEISGDIHEDINDTQNDEPNDSSNILDIKNLGYSKRSTFGLNFLDNDILNGNFDGILPDQNYQLDTEYKEQIIVNDESNDIEEKSSENMEFYWNEILVHQMYVVPHSSIKKFIIYVVSSFSPDKNFANPANIYIPASTFLLALRFSIFLGDFNLFEDLTECGNTAIHNVLVSSKPSIDLYSFWISNLLLLEYYLVRDPNLVNQSKSFVSQIHEILKVCYNLLINFLANDISNTIEESLLKYVPVPELIENIVYQKNYSFKQSNFFFGLGKDQKLKRNSAYRLPPITKKVSPFEKKTQPKKSTDSLVSPTNTNKSKNRFSMFWKADANPTETQNLPKKSETNDIENKNEKMSIDRLTSDFSDDCYNELLNQHTPKSIVGILEHVFRIL